MFKITNKLKMIIYILLIIITMGIIIAPVYADTDTGLKIVSTYSSDIKPSSGDIFVLTYRKATGNISSTIEVDASLVVNVGMIVPIDPDLYVIESIEYKGNNIDIDISGYGANNNIRVGYTQPGTLRILVGFNALKNYSKTFKDDFTVDEDTFYNYDKMMELGKITPQWYEETGTEMTQEDENYFLSFDTPISYKDFDETSSEEQTNNNEVSINESSNNESSIDESSNWIADPSTPQNVGGEIIPEIPESSINEEPTIEKDNSISMFILFGGMLVALIGVVIILKKKQII